MMASLRVNYTDEVRGLFLDPICQLGWLLACICFIYFLFVYRMVGNCHFLPQSI